jgi:acetyl-CoA acetyltransferase
MNDTQLSNAKANRPAIVGLGMTELGRVYGKTANDFAIEAIRLAADDAGIGVKGIDGVLTNCPPGAGVGLAIQRDLGLPNLRMLAEVQGYGSSAGQMVQYASMAIMNGMADVVACVFADAPLQEGKKASEVYGNKQLPAGMTALRRASGIPGPPASYAMAARRHMEQYGTTSEQLGAVAVAARQWAQLNPKAQMREPMTIADHQASRMIADPFHLLDCCIVSNGAIAVIVSRADRAADMAKPAVYVHGMGQAHAGYVMERGGDFGLVSPAAMSGPAALAMAGISVSDVDMAQLYDCFTFTTLITLEDYGFCAKGEGGKFVESGAIAPGGELPVNTGGGELSGYYMWGMTPLSEAVIQARGEGGERQNHKRDVIMVSGNGGVLDNHSTLILSPHQSLKGN